MKKAVTKSLETVERERERERESYTLNNKKIKLNINSSIKLVSVLDTG